MDRVNINTILAKFLLKRGIEGKYLIHKFFEEDDDGDIIKPYKYSMEYIPEDSFYIDLHDLRAAILVGISIGKGEVDKDLNILWKKYSQTNL